MRLTHAIIFYSSVLLATGCSHVATYNPTFAGQPHTFSLKIEGKALIHNTESEDRYVYSGKPTSFTGGGTSLSMPLGEITRRIATDAFSEIFTQGAEYSQSLDNLDTYAIVVHPVATQYSYAYNQMKNMGFAITPQVDLRIQVTVVDAAGNSLLDKTYSSGMRDGDAYMISGAPGEEVSKATHKVISDLMREATTDTYNAIKDQSVAQSAIQ